MPSFNRVMLIGRLTRDPEMRYTSTGLAVTSFSIAVDRRAKNQQGEKVTDFFRCTAWRQTAEFVNEYVKKGRLVAVDGRIELSEYTANDGTRKNGVDIVCDNVETLDSQREGEGGAGGDGGGYNAPRANSGGEARPAAGGQARPAARPDANDDNGYFPDEEAAPASPQRAARPAQAPAARGAAPAAAAPARGGAARPAAKPAETYPSDDFDDSDPFADE